MLRTIMSDIAVAKIRKLFKVRWLKPVFIILGILMLLAVIWVGFPMTGWAPIVGFVPRFIAMGVVLFVIFLVYGLKWRKRRKKAQELEEALVVEPVGDGAVLSEGMSEALAKLKKSGGKNFLYDLPW